MPDIPVMTSSSTDPEKWSPPSPSERSLSNASTADTESNHFDTIDFEDPEKQLTPQVSHRSDRPKVSRVNTRTSIGTPLGRTITSDPDFEVDWEEDEEANPRNWPLWYKGCVIGAISWTTWVVVLYSTSYTTGFAEMEKEFGVSELVVTLGVTTYLVGLAVGSVILAPISETYGRRPVFMGAILLFCLLIIPATLSRSVYGILVIRFLGALAGSAAVANSPGTISDIVDDEHRALAFSIWSIGPLNGPVFGPIIGGFVTETLGWRWTNWIVLIFAGLAWLFVCSLKETYAPVLLQKKAAGIREETGDPRYWCRYDERMPLTQRLKINLARPIQMTFYEPIVIFFNIYIALIYGILYLCFVAYPIVYQELRGWSQGISGLAFLGIGVGSLITIACEPLIRRMIDSHKVDPETGKPPSESMMSVVIIAAVLVPIGELWFAWTCYPITIHWIWPILAGIPFGAGNTAVFIYASNYLAHSYGIYSASAMASNAIIRSLLGGTLPLAGPALYRTLGPNWAGTLLGLLEVMIIPIPVVFYKYGHRIRMKSALISSMQEDKKRLDGKRAKRATKAAAKESDAAAMAGALGVEVGAVDSDGVVPVQLKEKEKMDV